jgi:hypothetical protein
LLLGAGEMPRENRLVAAWVLQLLLVLVLLVLLLLWGKVLLLLLLLLRVCIKRLLTVLRMLEIGLNLALQLKVALAVVMISEVVWGIR